MRLPEDLSLRVVTLVRYSILEFLTAGTLPGAVVQVKRPAIVFEIVIGCGATSSVGW